MGYYTKPDFDSLDAAAWFESNKLWTYVFLNLVVSALYIHSFVSKKKQADG